MSSKNFPTRDNGIYRNLPQFDNHIKDLTAIVTGANGISGFHTCRALLDSPQRWSKIYALSRRPPPEAMMSLLTSQQRNKVEHVACDFLNDPKKLASTLQRAGVTDVHYVFFYSYLQPKPTTSASPWSNAEELVDVNSTLFNNFLAALPILDLHPNRILLQTGAKNYGAHIGRERVPSLESDPQPTHLEQNFYYSQEAALFRYCEKHPETGWNIIMPAWIIGTTKNAQMNAMHPYAVYAAVTAHRNQTLVFPGDWTSWQGYQHQSSARLTGYLREWAVLEDKCKDQRFNSNDTGTISWDRIFERLAAWFGVSKGFQGPDNDVKSFQEVRGKSGNQTPMGYGPPTRSTEPRGVERDDGGKRRQVTYDPFNDVEAHFAFGDEAFMTIGCLGMNKARLMGWTGYVDTMDAIWEMYMEMGGDGESLMGMVPEMKMKQSLPMV